MPRIKTTRMVQLALWALRIYLLILLLLIGIKFLRVFANSQKQDKTNSPATVTITTNLGTVDTKP